MRIPTWFLGIAVALPIFQNAARADCWPPLNGTSQIIEAPVRVGQHVFGSGSYSFFVSRYSVPSLHCEKSINSGPRQWYLMVESGRVEVKGEPKGTRRGPLPPPAPSLPPLGSLPPLAANPNFNQGSALPALPALSLVKTPLAPLPPVAAMPALTDLPNINNIPDLPPLQ